MNKLMAGILATTVVTATAVNVYATETSNTVYGDIRYSFNHVDADGVGGDLQTDDNNSRMGLKGSISDGGDLQAIYHLQYATRIDDQTNTTDSNDDNAFDQRFFYGGLKGNFGQIVYGSKSSAYKMAGLEIDPFYDTRAGLKCCSANYGLSGMTNGWVDNTLAYTSPTIAGNIVLNASVHLDDSEADDHSYSAGAQFKNDSLTAGVQVASVDNTTVIPGSVANSTAVRVHASYTAGPLTLGVSAESIDVDNVSDEQQYLYVAGTYKINDKLKFSASYGKVDDNLDASADGDGITVGAFYNVLSKTQVYLLASDVDKDMGADERVISLGISQKFSFTHNGTY